MAKQPPIAPLLLALLAQSANKQNRGVEPVYVPGAPHPFPWFADHNPQNGRIMKQPPPLPFGFNADRLTRDMIYGARKTI
jgi:hypothetical protein